MSTDVPAPLEFVDPDAIDPTYRFCLWAAPGEGKSVAAASAPGPILALSADRPSAYKFVRKHWGRHWVNEDGERVDPETDDAIEVPAKEIREIRYQGAHTLSQVFEYLRQPSCDIRTLIVDPVSHIVDQLADAAPPNKEGGPDYQWVNKQVLRFVKGLRAFDINVVLVAYEKVNDGKKGDGKMYPQLGGMTLINKLLGEMDIVAHIERVVRTVDEVEQQLWVGQLQPRGNLVCKESTGALGDRRIADLTRWIEVADAAYAVDDVPFDTSPPAQGVTEPPNGDADPARDPEIEKQLAMAGNS